MTFSALGDMSRQIGLSRHSTRLKSGISILSKELTTGLAQDKPRRVKGDVAMIAGLEHKIKSASSNEALSQKVQLIFSSQQRVLDSIGQISEKLSLDVMSLGPVSDRTQLARYSESMYHGLSDVIGLLNTDVAGRGVFSGVVGTGPAVSSVDAMLDALASGIPAGADAAVISSYVDDWFSAGGGFESHGYLGGDPIPSDIDLGSGIKVQLKLTADDPAIRTTLAGFAKGALLHRDLSSLDQESGKAVLDDAARTLLRGKAMVLDTAAQIGVLEERAAKASSRASSENSALSIARSELLSIDPFEVASQLEQTMLQLEKMFSLTARLSRLTLADYLR